MVRSTRQPGGQPHNQNRVSHGLRASGLPASASYLEGQLRAFRSYVRQELAARGVDVGVFHEALLQSAVRHETRALLAAKWLRDKESELTIEQRLSLMAAVSSATDSRDKCLDRAGLSKDVSGSIIDMLYSSAPSQGVGASERTEAGECPSRPKRKTRYRARQSP